MNKLILCCTLLVSALSLAEDAGVAVVDTPTLTLTVTSGVSDAGVGIAPILEQPLLSAKGFYAAVKTGNGWLAAMFILFFVVGFMRVVGTKVHAMIPDDTKHILLKPLEAFLRIVFDTKLGGWVLNWLTAVGGCLAAATAAGAVVDAGAWRVALLASTGGTALIELKDDVVEWWVKRQEAKKKEAAAKLAVLSPSTTEPKS